MADEQAPIVVEIPGVGRRAFPATLSQQQIQANVQRLMQAGDGEDSSMPAQPIWRPGMSDTEQHVGFEQAKARSAYMMGKNPKGPYAGQLADLGSFKVDPEDVLGAGAAIGPNMMKRGSAGVSSLAETGNPFRAAGAAMKSQPGGIVTRLMDLVNGIASGKPAAADADIIPSQINPTGRTGTSFNLPDKSPLPVQPRWMVRPPKNLSMDRTDDLEGTLQRIMDGGVQVPGSPDVPRPIGPVPPNMTQTRTDDLIGTIQRMLKGVRP